MDGLALSMDNGFITNRNGQSCLMLTTRSWTLSVSWKEGRQHGWDPFEGLERIENNLKWRSKRLPTRSGKNLYFLGGYKMCYAVTIV